MWLNFYDDGFCDDRSTEGMLRLLYAVKDLASALDTLIADARRLGIEFQNPLCGAPCLYANGDGEDERLPLPREWRRLVAEQAKRLGWHDLYTESIHDIDSVFEQC